MENFNLNEHFKSMKENDTCVVMRVKKGNQIETFHMNNDFMDLAIKLYNLNRFEMYGV